MSLDVSLIIKGAKVAQNSSGIFVRENGQTVEVSEQEWENKYSGRVPVKFHPEVFYSDRVYAANITHNLGTMAEHAGIYDCLWRPDENNITTAKELIEPLRQGLHILKSEPERFKKLNPGNGWGTYKGLVKFVDNYLNACYEYPEAEVHADR